MNAGVVATTPSPLLRSGARARRAVLQGVALLMCTGSVFAQGNSGPPPALPVSVVEVAPTSLPNQFEITAQAEGAREAERDLRGSRLPLSRRPRGRRHLDAFPSTRGAILARRQAGA